MERIARIDRTTKETSISCEINACVRDTISLESPIAFFNHLLNAMCFHGNFGIRYTGSGDIEVDYHHLVEDTGIALGQVFSQIRTGFGPVRRFGHAVVPMDEACSEVTIDASGRPFLVYDASYPQEYSGEFPMSLINEFLVAFTNNAGITLHARCLYGSNSHHMAECLFKALGKALSRALSPAHTVESTKGSL